MARTVTVGQLTSSVRLRADLDDDRGDDYVDSFVSRAAMLDFLSSAWAEVYDHVVTVDPERVATTYDLTTAAGTEAYDLPSDHYRLLAVDARQSSGSGGWSPVDRYGLGERDLFQAVGTSPWADSHGLAYRLAGERIYLSPAPQASYSVRLTYVPVASRLTGSDQTIDGVNGFEELVVQKAVRMCQARSQEDTSEARAEIAQQTVRVDRMAADRDRGRPKRLVSSRRRWPRRSGW